ncbi:hypothetical protein FKM82_028865 [Ascaphus truei]
METEVEGAPLSLGSSGGRGERGLAHDLVISTPSNHVVVIPEVQWHSRGLPAVKGLKSHIPLAFVVNPRGSVCQFTGPRRFRRGVGGGGGGGGG